MVRITKAVAEKMLEAVPREKSFWCSDGRVLRNLQELEAALRDMSEGTFSHHSTETHSDFSNWVRDVIGDEKLSRDLRKSTTRVRATKKVADRIAWLQSKMAGV